MYLQQAPHCTMHLNGKTQSLRICHAEHTLAGCPAPKKSDKSRTAREHLANNASTRVSQSFSYFCTVVCSTRHDAQSHPKTGAINGTPINGISFVTLTCTARAVQHQPGTGNLIDCQKRRCLCSPSLKSLARGRESTPLRVPLASKVSLGST